MKDNFDLLVKIAKHLGIDTKLEERFHELEKNGKKLIPIDCLNCKYPTQIFSRILHDYLDGWLDVEFDCPICNHSMVARVRKELIE